MEKNVKKNWLLGLTLVASVCASMLVGTPAAAANPKLKIGMAVQDVNNPFWAAVCQNIQKDAQKDGAEMSYVACDSNVAKQIQQVENYISSGVKVIIVQSADPAGIESVLKEARTAGIKVLSWDDKLENADASWMINNYDLGYMIGDQAAAWINSKLGGSAEVAVLNYPQLPILLQRGNGIVAALKAKAPKAKIVAETSAINPAEGQNKMETIFQAHPNVKVVCAIGGGGAVGANEAAKAANKITPQFGIFAADATAQELEAMKANEGNRMSVMVTGGPVKTAQAVYDLAKKLGTGVKVPKDIFRTLTAITSKNTDLVL
jgi:ribose transport system substrate-binding protein